MSIWSVAGIKPPLHTHGRESAVDSEDGEPGRDAVATNQTRRNPVLRRIAVHDRYQLELKLGYPLLRVNRRATSSTPTCFCPPRLPLTAQPTRAKTFTATSRHTSG